MAITQVTAPASVPAAIADYEAQNAHISAFNMIVNNQPFILTNSENTSLPAIAIGSYIQFGGNLYIVDTEDYAITGTPVDGNNYVRLSGTTTLTAEWIQDISTYVWNPVYGYKYTGSYAILPYLVVKASTEYEKYSLFSNDVAFNGKILDQYGREVKALQIKTVQSAELNILDADLPYTLTLNGFGFTPTAVIRIAAITYDYPNNVRTVYTDGNGFSYSSSTFTSDGVTLVVSKLADKSPDDRQTFEITLAG